MVQQSGPKSPQKTYMRVLRPCEHGPSCDGPKGVNVRVTRHVIVILRHARHASRRQWYCRRREVSWWHRLGEHISRSARYAALDLTRINSLFNEIRNKTSMSKEKFVPFLLLNPEDYRSRCRMCKEYIYSSIVIW